MPAPPFDEAIERFQQFLAGQGWPTEIVWSRQEELEDMVWQSGTLTVQIITSADARDRYEAGSRRGLGVLLEARCTLNGRACASVASPKDEDEAARFMYPSDGGLKLNAAIPRAEGLAHEATSGLVQ